MRAAHAAATGRAGLSATSKNEVPMQSDYWADALRSRLSRRRAVLGSASAAGAAAFLAACGGSDNNKGATAKSDLVEESKDTTAQAVRGGTLKAYMPTDVPSLDPSTASFPLNFVAGYVLGTLLNEKPGYLAPPQAEL